VKETEKYREKLKGKVEFKAPIDLN